MKLAGIRTIRGRMVLAIFVVGCVPLLIGLALASMSGMRSLRDVIGANFQAIAAQAAERVAALVQSEIQSVRLLASAPLRLRQPVQEANHSYPSDLSKAMGLIEARIKAWDQGTEVSTHILSSELSRFLLDTKVRNGDKFVGLMVVDRYGALVAASSEPDRYFFAEEPWWQDLKNGETSQVYLSELIASRQGSFETTEETIDIAVPILDDHQRTMIGAIKVSYRFDVLFALINQIRIGQTGHAMLFNADGLPLVCPILPRQAHRIHDSLMRLIVSQEPGWAIADDDAHGAHDTVVGFAPVRGLDSLANTWHVLVRQHPSESYAPIREQLRNLAVIGLVMIVLLAAMGRYVGTRIAKPIQTLRQGVEAISQGTYHGPLDIKTGDEFEELAAAVHRMADNLKTSHLELEALNQDLARRVEEKTTEVTRQLRKLELSERLATIGKVASGIAHEINNPLGIILNRIECMEAEAAELPLPEELVRDLAAIRAQAGRISRVTKSMLALSRGAATTLKPIDLNCVVRACLTAAGERVAAHQIRLETNLDSDLPPVMGDRDRLETVVLNLVNNAIDAIQEAGGQGVVTLSTGSRKSEEGQWVEVTVSDNGPGIPEEIRHRIFDPFFTTKEAGKGTGLGLFLSYGIVSDHRGRLEVTSNQEGTEFSVMLPALVAAPAVDEREAWESRAGS
jgi:signal transduction histidine kinase